MLRTTTIPDRTNSVLKSIRFYLLVRLDCPEHHVKRCLSDWHRVVDQLRVPARDKLQFLHLFILS